MIDLKNLNIVLTGSTGVIGNSMILHNLINADQMYWLQEPMKKS